MSPCDTRVGVGIALGLGFAERLWWACHDTQFRVRASYRGIYLPRTSWNACGACRSTAPLVLTAVMMTSLSPLGDTWCKSIGLGTGLGLCSGQGIALGTNLTRPLP